MNAFSGRKRETALLQDVLDSRNPELVAIYGRRRVGKTRLIRQFFSDKSIFFEITGTRKATNKVQLFNFSRAFSEIFYNGARIDEPKTWSHAFELFLKEMEKQETGRRIVLFIDELPWLATKNSQFIQALEYYWNRYFSQDPRWIVIVCGSSSSWMIKKVVHNRGGLFGRVTRVLRLLPFQLSEVKEFLIDRNIRLDQKQMIDLYIALGGIPQYLGMIKKGASSVTAINDLFFQPNAFLLPEFDRVFSSLFGNYESHVRIIRALASKFSGLTKSELLKMSGLKSGGTSSQKIKELQESGFIAYIPDFGEKTTGGRYVLIDEFSLYYLVWVASAQKIIPETLDSDHWFKMHRSQKWKAWSGYAFESLCLKHVQQIKAELGISGVRTVESGWSFVPKKGDKRAGAQIDLVIDRDDKCINLVEIKYSEGPFTITKAYAKQLEYKKYLFRDVTKTKKTLFTTLLTTSGLTENEYALSSVDSKISADALFLPH